MKHLLPFALLTLLLVTCRQPTVRMDSFAVHGIDVSHHQSYVDWARIAAQNIDFAFIKATEGHTFVDTLYCHNWEALQREGILRGAYHFFRPTLDATIQAQNFISSVLLQPGDLPPVIDAEVLDEATPAQLRARLRVWVDSITTHYGVAPILYTNVNFYNDHLAGHFDELPLWLARYHGDAPSTTDDRAWQFWQYGNRGRLDGVGGDIDFNVFYGSYSQLQDLTVDVPMVLSAR